MADDLDEQIGLPDDLARQVRPVIGRLPLNAQQPVSVRGVNLPQPAPSDAAGSVPRDTTNTALGDAITPGGAGSTSDLEKRAAVIPAQLGASLRAAAKPDQPSPLEAQTAKDEATRQQLGKGSGISQIGNPWARGALRGLNVAGEVASAFLPQVNTVLRAIPGTEEHHNQLVARNNAALTADQAAAEKDALTGEAKARTDQAAAQAENQRAEAAARAIPKPEKPEDVQHLYADAVNDAIMRGVNPNDDPKVKQLADTITSLQKQPAEKDLNPQHEAYQAYIAQGLTPAEAYEKVRERVPNPQRELLQVPVDPNDPSKGTRLVEGLPGMVIPAGATKAGAPAKGATADEQRRADLADNMNENLNQLEGILDRRPELFGPVSGRITGLRETIGTSDPDVAALKTLEEQMGMAMVGAHAMRNAQHVETAARAVTNSFHNSPTAIKQAIKTARQSLATFQNDVGTAAGSTAKPKNTTSGGEPPPNTKDPLGIL